MRRSLALATLLAVVLSGAPASAHEVLHTVERGKAIALRAYFPNGDALAYVEYQVFSPADPKIPYQKGRTDRSGYVAFVPDVTGKWRVKIEDATGHGLDTEIDVADVSPANGSKQGDVDSAIAFVLRPLLGVAIVGAVFGALMLGYRRKGRGGSK